MAGLSRDLGETIDWADRAAGPNDALMFVDAPLVVRNETGPALVRNTGRAEIWPVEGQR